MISSSAEFIILLNPLTGSFPLEASWHSLAFSRSFVFMLITMLVLPALLGVTGIWLATPVAELMALALGAAMFLKYRTRYHI